MYCFCVSTLRVFAFVQCVVRLCVYLFECCGFCRFLALKLVLNADINAVCQRGKLVVYIIRNTIKLYTIDIAYNDATKTMP